MAFKFTIDYVDLKLTIDSDATESVTTFAHAAMTVSYTNFQAATSYVNMNAVDVKLDADSKNLYFTTQYSSPHALTLIMGDAISSIGTSLGKADTFTFVHALTKDFGKGTALDDSTVSLGDAAAIAVQYNRSYAETPSVTDAVSSIGTSLGKADTIGVTELPTLSVAKALTETFSFTDSSSYLVAKAIPEAGETEVFSVTDSFARVAQFARTFTDAFTLDDRTSVQDILQTDTTLTKGNIVTMSEELSSAVGKAAADTATLSESLANAFTPGTFTDTVSLAEALQWSFSAGKADSISAPDALTMLFSSSYSDSAAISDSILVELIVGGGPLNATALNSAMLNA